MEESIKRLFEIGDFERAIKYLNEAIAEDPDDVESIRHVAVAYTESGQFEAAQKALSHYFSSVEEPEAEVHETQGILYFRQHEFGKAEHHLLRCIELDQYNANAMRNLAMLYKITQHHRESDEYLYASIAIDPYNYLTQVALSQRLIEAGDYDDAKIILQHIIDSEIEIPEDKKEYIESLIDLIP
jgi:Tfp pilus assembly protein PilF